MRKLEPNTALQDSRPEGNLRPDDEIVIPQDDLYVITWETNFGEFPNSNAEVTISTRLDATDNSNSLEDDACPPDENCTDVDLLSTRPHDKEVFDLTKETWSERSNDRIDDQQSSGGSDTIVPEVSDDENDDMIVDNESTKGEKQNLRPNPIPNFTDEYEY